MMKKKKFRCPRCKKFGKWYPAISRLDNVTEICPECAEREAMSGVKRELTDEKMESMIKEFGEEMVEKGYADRTDEGKYKINEKGEKFLDKELRESMDNPRVRKLAEGLAEQGIISKSTLEGLLKPTLAMNIVDEHEQIRYAIDDLIEMCSTAPDKVEMGMLEWNIKKLHQKHGIKIPEKAIEVLKERGFIRISDNGKHGYISPKCVYWTALNKIKANLDKEDENEIKELKRAISMLLMALRVHLWENYEITKNGRMFLDILLFPSKKGIPNPLESPAQFIKNDNNLFKTMFSMVQFSIKDFRASGHNVPEKDRQSIDLAFNCLLNEGKVFKISQPLTAMLEKTNNKVYGRHLPFPIVFIDTNIEVNKRLHIFGLTLLRIHSIAGENEFCRDLNCKEDHGMMVMAMGYDPTDNGIRYLYESVYPDGVEKKDKQYKELKDITTFACNFLDFLNEPSVQYIKHDEGYKFTRTMKNQLKDAEDKKLDMNKTYFVKIEQPLKRYVDEFVTLSRHQKFTHRFWVRGHFRTLRKKERFGENVGKKIWITPFIKGTGVLLEKQYDTRHSHERTRSKTKAGRPIRTVRK